jgi:hypothetical protein
VEATLQPQGRDSKVTAPRFASGDVSDVIPCRPASRFVL